MVLESPLMVTNPLLPIPTCFLGYDVDPLPKRGYLPWKARLAPKNTLGKGGYLE